jgi:hypothetical protein
MDLSTGWDFLKRHRITRSRLDTGTRHKLLSFIHANWRQYVALFPITIMQQRNMSRPVRVIFNTCDDCWHAFLVSHPVDHSVSPACTTSPMANSHFTGIIPTRMTLKRPKQLL